MPRQVPSQKIDAKPHRTSKLSSAQVDESPESNDSRLQKISDAAYFIAQERGFEGGSQMDDWLAAEAIIDGKAFSLSSHAVTAN